MRSIGILLVLGIWIVLYWVVTYPSQDRQPFVPKVWLESLEWDTTNDPGCFRGGMAIDLIEGKLLLEKSAAEVVALLGEPLARKRDSGDWIYPLGQCSTLGWMHSELRLIFDERARVKAAEFQRTPLD